VNLAFVRGSEYRHRVTTKSRCLRHRNDVGAFSASPSGVGSPRRLRPPAPRRHGETRRSRAPPRSERLVDGVVRETKGRGCKPGSDRCPSRTAQPRATFPPRLCRGCRGWFRSAISQSASQPARGQVGVGNEALIERSGNCDDHPFEVLVVELVESPDEHQSPRLAPRDGGALSADIGSHVGQGLVCISRIPLSHRLLCSPGLCIR